MMPPLRTELSCGFYSGFDAIVSLGKPAARRESLMRCMRWLLPVFLSLIVAPQSVFGQTDEIQVYDGGLAAPGIFNLTLHTNFTPSGLRTPASSGLEADKSL